MVQEVYINTTLSPVSPTCYGERYVYIRIYIHVQYYYARFAKSVLNIKPACWIELFYVPL